jgi:hypothetical protein
VKAHFKDDVPTLLAIGVLVSIAASLAHEALGHGVGCLMDGGHITLITFLVFRCAGAGALADGGGPIKCYLQLGRLPRSDRSCAPSSDTRRRPSAIPVLCGAIAIFFRMRGRDGHEKNE